MWRAYSPNMTRSDFKFGKKSAFRGQPPVAGPGGKMVPEPAGAFGEVPGVGAGVDRIEGFLQRSQIDACLPLGRPLGT